MNMIKKLHGFSLSSLYWGGFILGGLALLGVALFYQHALEELPCVVCIQIRLWVSWLVIIAFIGFFVKSIRGLNILMQVGLVAGAIGLAERSYLLLGTEKGFIFGGCGFDLGVPAWFAVEQWLPWIYKVETSCGYTPEIIFGITMAESLMVLSGVLVALSGLILMATLFNKK